MSAVQSNINTKCESYLNILKILWQYNNHKIKIKAYNIIKNKFNTLKQCGGAEYMWNHDMIDRLGQELYLFELRELYNKPPNYIPHDTSLRLPSEFKQTTQPNTSQQYFTSYYLPNLVTTDQTIKLTTDTKLEADKKTKFEADTKAKFKRSDNEGDLSTKLEVDAKAKLEADAKAKTKLEADKKTKLEADAKAKAKTKLEADKKAKLEAKAKLEDDNKAKTKLEADNKAKLEADAKANAKTKLEANRQQAIQIAQHNLQTIKDCGEIVSTLTQFINEYKSNATKLLQKIESEKSLMTPNKYTHLRDHATNAIQSITTSLQTARATYVEIQQLITITQQSITAIQSATNIKTIKNEQQNTIDNVVSANVKLDYVRKLRIEAGADFNTANDEYNAV
jgi:hypothetical protein